MLGFSVPSLEKLENVNIRVSPTVSPNAALGSSDVTSFFIRPEDLSLYENAINIIDFKVTDQDKEDTLFKIYKRGSFLFDLSQLIENLNQKTPNKFIPQGFGKYRLDCGQRCKIPGRSCHLCQTELSYTNTMMKYFEQENIDK